MNPYKTPALQIAHNKVVTQRRQFVPNWREWWEGPALRHYLVLGMGQHVYDRCHNVSICSAALAPYPAQVLVRPYLREISRMQGGERPAIHRTASDRQAPLYFKSPTVGELYLVDLEAAYWQIYAPTSLDLIYDGTGYPTTGRVRFLGADELRGDKQLRNAVMGTVRAQSRRESDFGKVKKVDIGPMWRRIDLWDYVMDVLEAVAWDMRSRFGAVHIHTDGYVFRHRDLAEDAIDWLSREWSLRATIRAQGEGKVLGLGSWRIGSEVAGEPDARPGEPIDNMSQVHIREDLRAWHVDAVAYRKENRNICCKGLDGRSVEW